ncbi:MAG: hypothetical protein K2X93_05020, partial [Candidatus Obscuribacterales bacterium]|nr:hypothetical protein [Candidatus Obscuribacterales bacterium]
MAEQKNFLLLFVVSLLCFSIQEDGCAQTQPAQEETTSQLRPSLPNPTQQNAQRRQNGEGTPQPAVSTPSQQLNGTSSQSNNTSTSP